MRRAAFALGAAVMAGAVVLVIGVARGWWRGTAQVAPPSRPLVATASLSTRSVRFGDPMTARLNLLVNPRKANPATLRVKPRFSPYRVVAATLRTRSAGATLLSYRYALECVTPGCLPGRAQAELRFLPTLVS